jgi:hypothetical protein
VLRVAEDCYSRKLSRLSSKMESEKGEPIDIGQIIDTAVSKALQDVDEDISLVDCHSKSVTSLNQKIVEMSKEELRQQTPRLQSELFTMNLMFTSSLSQLHDAFLERVKAHLRPFPRRLKEQLLVGVEQNILHRLIPMIERYLEGVQDIAQRIGVESYSISIGIGIIQFTFTFGIPKP